MAELLELSSSPSDDEGERVTVCRVDGEDITMPKNLPAGLVLREMRKNVNQGATVTGEMDFVEKILGTEALDKILDSGATSEEWKAVVNRIYLIAMGVKVDESPDGENPGNGETDSGSSTG